MSRSQLRKQLSSVDEALDNTHDSLKERRKSDRELYRDFARRRSSQEDFEHSDDQSWVRRIQSFNSMTGKASLSSSTTNANSKGKGLASLSGNMSPKSFRMTPSPSPLQPQLRRRRTESTSSSATHTRKPTLDNWKDLAAEMETQQIPIFPPHQSPLGRDTSQSTPVSPKMKRATKMRARDASSQSISERCAAQSQQAFRQNLVQDRKHWKLGRNDVGHLASKFERIEDQQWVDNIKGMDTLTRMEHNLGRTFAFDKHQINSPLSEESSRGQHRGRTNTLQEWKLNIEAEEEDPSLRPDLPIEFGNIDDQKWTENITRMDTLRRFKKGADPFANQDFYGHTDSLGHLDEDAPASEDDIASLQEREQLFSSLTGSSNHRRQNTLQGWKEQVAQQEIDDGGTMQHANKINDFEEIGDQQWTQQVKRMDTMKRMRKTEPLSPGLFSPPKFQDGKIEERDDEELQGNEIDGSHIQSLPLVDDVRTCVRDLLRAIISLFNSGRISAQQKGKLKQFVLEQNSVLFGAARNFRDHDGSSQLQNFLVSTMD